MHHRKILILGMTLLLGVPASQAKKEVRGPAGIPLTPQQQRLVQQAIAREKVIIKQIQKSTPVVQSFSQDLRPDTKLYQVPVSDQYMIGRVDFGKAFTADEYAQAGRSQPHHGWLAGSFSFMSDLTKAFHLKNSPTGFMAMMFLDPTGFDTQHYVFSFVRPEFLGAVRTWVYDVHPKVPGMGRFYGRIWVEDEEGNVVRFNGTYTGPPTPRMPPGITSTSTVGG